MKKNKFIKHENIKNFKIINIPINKSDSKYKFILKIFKTTLNTNNNSMIKLNILIKKLIKFFVLIIQFKFVHLKFILSNFYL